MSEGYISPLIGSQCCRQIGGLATEMAVYFDYPCGVEQWKTAFYKLERWDPASGYPTRKTLESLGLKNAADLLQAGNRLGRT